MLSNFLRCPTTIDDEATKMEELQPVLNRETEDQGSRLFSKVGGAKIWQKVEKFWQKVLSFDFLIKIK